MNFPIKTSARYFFGPDLSIPEIRLPVGSKNV
jgi:hypothetical protein